MSPIETLLAGAGTVFESLGRNLLCLGPDFRIAHVSDGLDPSLVGRPVEEVLGTELFGPLGLMRHALLAGERREGWSATLDTGRGRPRQACLSVAPIRHHPSGVCDPAVAYAVMLRPAEKDGSAWVLMELPAAPERDRIRFALEAHQWRREETARALGMSRTTLWRRMRELGLAGPKRPAPG